MAKWHPRLCVLPTFALLAGTVAVSLSFGGSPGRADTRTDCFGPDRSRRIEACTRLLEQPLAPETESLAYSMRALAYALRGRYKSAISDYDQSIAINPNFSHALNNRAWAYFKMGRPEAGAADVERALELAPRSAYAYDTRAHIYQSLGDTKKALDDYNRAIRYGGSPIIKLYQCGLQAHGLFSGLISGIDSHSLRGALETCVQDPNCDPLPPDEECLGLTS